MGENEIKSVAVSGAGGFIGSHLGKFLTAKGVDFIPLHRDYFTEPGMERLVRVVERADVVVNLAGAPIDHRWTKHYKQSLYSSRINTTRKLIEAIEVAGKKPRVFFSASAVGYYSGPGCHDERDGVKGTGFLSDLCMAWESEALRADRTVRTVIMRFGLVMSPDGGVLKKFRLPAAFKIAPVFGNGRQIFPWIALDDLAGALWFIARKEKLSGVFNFVAPEIITNREFFSALSTANRSWVRLPVPPVVFRAALGQASATVLTGQCVKPAKLIEAGFRYKYPNIESFFRGNG
ncbi:MAG: TIGR01777 family oxidoreductase [Alistipes sp.]|nr:TIGR01777 family oxidoreductase [Alistipes sp.]